MKALVAVSAVAVVALLGVSSAQADPEADPGAGEANYGGPPSSPRLVDHTEWAQWGSLPSLRVYPSQVGRTASRRLGMAAADAAWAEVLALSPEADTAGMRAQFICHAVRRNQTTRQTQLEPRAVAAGRRRLGDVGFRLQSGQP